jgi:hypothetical protein
MSKYSTLQMMDAYHDKSSKGDSDEINIGKNK